MLTSAAEVENAETQDTLKPTDAQDRINKAFTNNGQVRKVHNLVLQPYSASREVAGQAMGLHYAYVDKTGQARFARTKLYPGALRDVAIVAWLCAKATEDEIDAAGVEPKLATKTAVEWARGEGLFDTGSEKFLDVYAEFFAIMDSIWDSRVSVEKKTTDSPAKTE